MIHSWTRFWTRPDGVVSNADQGFLVGPAESHLLVAPSPDLWTFDEIASLRCLILLGEPGLGKSQTLRAEAEELLRRTDASADLVLQVDLGSTRDESVLERELFGSPEYQAWAESAGELHLFLDSLDEAVIRLGVVGDIILRGLTRADTPRLRLRIACRTADRLLDFETKLRDLWPKAESGVYELAQLRRADVRRAAEDRNLEPDHFIAQLVERDIVPLAMKPVTLNLLLDLASTDDGLPNSQLELYRRGLRHLVAEPERRDRDPTTVGRLEIGQRLAVAGRIAAATVVSGRTRIALADTHDDVDVATLAQLGGGSESDPDLAVPTPFEVSASSLREVLDTGLFSARGQDLGWAHQTYGEYLAARYLTTSNIPTRQVVALLTATADGQRVVPQLRDVAGWASAMDDALLDELLRRDPLVLLRGDLALVDDHRKGRIAAAILDPDVARELDRWDPRIRRNLAGLNHDGLPNIIRPFLSDNTSPDMPRSLACEICRICHLESLATELVELALRREEDVQLRASAVRALAKVGNQTTLRQLEPLARDNLPEDVDDELKGTALQAICPAVVTAPQALTFLTPQKNTHLYGAYTHFLSTDLASALSPDELPTALTWVGGLDQEPYQPIDDFGRLAEQILVQGAEHSDNPAVLDALAETIAVYLNKHQELQSYRTRDTSDAFQVDATRERLIRALLPIMRQGRLSPVALATSTPRLLDGSDLPWLIGQLNDCVGGEDEEIWAELADWSARFGGDEDLLMESRATSPVLHERTLATYGPIELNSALAAQLRAQHEQRREWEAKHEQHASTAPDFDANIELLLDQFESGDLDAFWRLNIDIWGKPGDHIVELGGSDLTSSPGWERASPARRARIASAAITYLLRYPSSEVWLDPGRHFYAAAAGYRALRYAADHNPEAIEALAGSGLCNWVISVITFASYGERDPATETFDTWSMRLVADRCSDLVTELAWNRISAEAARNEGHLFVLDRLCPILGSDIGVALLGRWRASDLPALPSGQLLGTFLRESIAGAPEAGFEALEAELAAGRLNHAVALAVASLDNAGDEAWPRLRSSLVDRQEFGKRVFQALASDRGARVSDFRVNLPDQELSNLFVWLSERFPLENDPPLAGTRFLGPDDAISEYRDGIIRLLAERGTASSVAALADMTERTGRDLTYAQIRARENWRRSSWITPGPNDVVQLAADARRRVILSASDLQHVLMENLEALQDMLSADGQAHQLWDTYSMRPKQETEVAAWIADRLREKLGGRTIVNREVEVRVNPLGGVGDRTDIHVDALAHEGADWLSQVTVVIEAKGCWHRSVLTAMRDQLVADYLTPSRPHGIYAVVYFNQTQWSDEDPRRRAGGRYDPAQLQRTLQQQADELRVSGYFVEPLVIDASLNADRDI